MILAMRETVDNRHFVPQFYLRNFAIPGEKSLVWEFDKQRGRYSKAPKSIRSICARYRYYRQVREDGTEEPDSLEQGFSIQIERKLAALYKSINLRIAEGSDHIELTPSEYGQLCYGVAIQYTRVPDFRDKMALFMGLRAEQIFDSIVESQRKDGTLPPEIDEMLREGRPKPIIEEWGTIKTMLEAAVSVSNALMEKTPGFFRAAPGSCFVTSDNPVSYFVRDYKNYDVRQIEPVHPNAEVTFPLSQKNAVTFFPHKSGYGSTHYAIECKCLDLLAPLVNMINGQTRIMAERYVYAPIRLSNLLEKPTSGNEGAEG